MSLISTAGMDMYTYPRVAHNNRIANDIKQTICIKNKQFQ